jgi:hypothetical protein
MIHNDLLHVSNDSHHGGCGVVRDKVVSTAVICVYGQHLSEVPPVATSLEHQSQLSWWQNNCNGSFLLQLPFLQNYLQWHKISLSATNQRMNSCCGQFFTHLGDEFFTRLGGFRDLESSFDDTSEIHLCPLDAECLQAAKKQRRNLCCAPSYPSITIQNTHLHCSSLRRFSVFILSKPGGLWNLDHTVVQPGNGYLDTFT